MADSSRAIGLARLRAIVREADSSRVIARVVVLSRVIARVVANREVTGRQPRLEEDDRQALLRGRRAAEGLARGQQEQEAAEGGPAAEAAVAGSVAEEDREAVADSVAEEDRVAGGRLSSSNISLSRYIRQRGPAGRAAVCFAATSLVASRGLV